MAPAVASLEPQTAATLRTLALHAARMVGATHAWILLRDPDDPAALETVAATNGDPVDQDAAARCLAGGEAVTGRAGGRFARGGAPGGPACVPILGADGTIGVLAVAGTNGLAPFDDGLDALADLAEVIGGVLEQAEVGRQLAGTVQAGIEALASLLDLRDGYAASDAGEVARLAVQVAGRLRLSRAGIAQLGIAGRVHDIGKIGVPDRILQKPGKLEPEERAVMENHPVWGAETLERIPGLEGVAEIVRCHHERWDGRGYPAGLAGEEIPVAARIIGACEAYRAMTSNRPYRRALAPDRALGLLEQGSGNHFDPAVVESIVAVLGEHGISAAAAPARSRATAPTPSRPAGAYHALPAAFERLEGLPALSESRDRLLAILREAAPSTTAIIEAVASDVALVIAVLRVANHRRGGRQIAGVREAVEVLTPEGVEQLATQMDVADFFERRPAWPSPPEPFRAHAVAVQRAADLLAREVGYRDVDELLVAALLHDVGALVLAHAYRGYPDDVHAGARTPDERVRAERRTLGVDHALVGGVLLRRWALPDGLARAVERHHSDDAEAEPSLLRLADMLAHHAHGRAVDPQRLLEAAQRVGLAPTALRGVMFELPSSSAATRRASEPCPLTDKELAALRGLAEGKVYKEIADDLGIATSTVRSHLHKTYKKVGAADRAQAVLIATERGWL